MDCSCHPYPHASTLCFTLVMCVCVASFQPFERSNLVFYSLVFPTTPGRRFCAVGVDTWRISALLCLRENSPRKDLFPERWISTSLESGKSVLDSQGELPRARAIPPVPCDSLWLLGQFYMENGILFISVYSLLVQKYFRSQSQVSRQCKNLATPQS